MFPAQKHNRITKIIVLALLVNLAIANFAFAQEDRLDSGTGQAVAPAQTKEKIVINRQALDAAQASVEACRKFKDDLWNASNKQMKAVWWPGKSTRVGADTIQPDLGKGCYVVDKGWNDQAGITRRDPVGRFIGSYTLQDQIKYSEKGISGEQFIKAQNQDDVEKNQAAPISTVIGWVLEMILGVVASVLAQITALAAGIFDFAINSVINVTIMPEVVDVGWAIVRDICNMFFILAFIVMALMTILRIKEDYNFRAVLPKLVIMAILVNFSQVIAVTIMNAVNFLAAVFWNGVELNYIYSSLMRIVNPVNDLGSAITGGWLGGLAAGLGKVVFAAVAAVVFVALAAMFVIRLVGLYILIIFSPVAYVARILPATHKFSEEWWSKFFKYLIWAPLALFMLRLTFLTADKLEQLSALGGGVKNGVATSSAFVFFILTAFMAAALLVAEQAGMVGSKMIMAGVHKAQQGMMLGAKALGGGAVGLVGRSYTKAVTKRQDAAEGEGRGRAASFWRAAQFANLRVAKEAWEKRSKEKEEEAYVPAVGHTHDTLNRVMPTEWHKDEQGLHLGQKTFYGRIGQRQVINHKQKIIKEAGLSEEEKVEAFKGATHPEDQEAWFAELQSGRNEDGYAILSALKQREVRAKELEADMLSKGEKPEAAWAKANLQAEEEIPAEFDVVDYDEVLQIRLAHEGLNSEQIGSRMAHLAEQAEAEQKIRGLGVETYEFDGKFRASSDLTGYQKLEKAQGSSEMLKAIKELKINGMTIEKEVDVTDASGVVVKDANGNIVKKIEKLKFDGKEITDYASLQKVLDETKGKDAKDRIQRRNNQTDLKYEMIGARKNASADKRMMRGDSERWARALEPAAYMVQNEEGKFTRFTSFGRRRFANTHAATVTTFRKTRGVQARVLKMAGIYQDEKTGEFDTSKFNYDVMAEGIESNEDFSTAIIGKAALEDADLEKVRIKLNAALASRGSTKRYSTLPEFTKEVNKKV